MRKAFLPKTIREDPEVKEVFGISEDLEDPEETPRNTSYKTKKCDRCGKEFKPKTARQRFCSHSCAQKPRFCLFCGKRLDFRLTHNRKPFCDEECQLGYDLKRYSERKRI